MNSLKISEMLKYKKLLLKKIAKAGVVLMVLSSSIGIDVYRDSVKAYSDVCIAPNVTNERDKTIYIGNESIIDAIYNSLGKKPGLIKNFVNTRDLRQLTELKLFSLGEKDKLSFLGYCSSLKKLELSGSNYDEKTISLPNTIEYLSISKWRIDVSEIPFEEADHLKNLTLKPTIGEIKHPEKLYDLKNLKELNITVDGSDNIDFRKIKNLEHLIIYGEKYGLPIFFTDQMIKEVREQVDSVEFKDFDGNDIESEIRKVNKKLDKIVERLHIRSNDTDEEKLSKILGYALDNFEYYENIGAPIRGNTNHNIVYREGLLTAVFEQKQQICGNYAAFVSSTANRVGLESYIMQSSTHYWNLININNEYYYYDATRLDEEEIPEGLEGKYKSVNDLIKKGSESEKEELYGYKMDPFSFEENTDFVYSANNRPTIKENN